MKPSCLIVAKQNKTKHHSNKSSCVLLRSGNIQPGLELSWACVFCSGLGGALGRVTGRGEAAEGQTHRTCSLRTAANESSMQAKQACAPRSPPLAGCCHGWVPAAGTSLNLKPSPLCSEVALVLSRSRRRLQAAECVERSRRGVPTWLLQSNVSISCPGQLVAGLPRSCLSPELSAPARSGGK